MAIKLYEFAPPWVAVQCLTQRKGGDAIATFEMTFQNEDKKITLTCKPSQELHQLPELIDIEGVTVIQETAPLSLLGTLCVSIIGPEKHEIWCQSVVKQGEKA